MITKTKTRQNARGDGALAGWLMSTAMGVSAAAAFGAPAMALEAEGDVQQTITVIGQRADEEVASPKSTAPLLDTPMTVSIIPSEVFHRSRRAQSDRRAPEHTRHHL